VSLTTSARIEAAIGQLLRRSTRAHLYQSMVDGLDGVDATTYPVLSGVARWQPVSATNLALEIGIDRTATTRYASRLQQAGLIDRVPDPTDARATLIRLTPDGERIAATMRERLVEHLETATADWPESQAQQFAVSLERLVDTLSRR
jgi:DNA-binding MarR family transcriptional regulator